MKKCLLIINPASGQKKIKRKAVDILEIFNSHDWEEKAFATQKRKDAKYNEENHGRQAVIIVC